MALDANMDVLEKGPRPVQFYLWPLSQVVYTAAIQYVGRTTYEDTVADGAAELEDDPVKTYLTAGYDYIIPFFVAPIVIWSFASILFKFLFRFGMGTVGFISLIGALGGTAAASFLDDFGFIILGRRAADTFGLSEDAGVAAVYDLYPKYKTARW